MKAALRALRILIAAIVALSALGSRLAIAHEIRPAYLEITEVGKDQYQVIWRTPLLSGMRLPVALALPEGARELSMPSILERSNSLIERKLVEIPGGLSDKRLGFPGLQATITDVLVRIEMLDGRQITEIVRPSQPHLDVGASSGLGSIAATYTKQGIRHILEGWDHLLFVFGLMLLVRSPWMLLKTITAFTLAHSVALAAATFGLIHVPSRPLDAAIALSILFLGVEVYKAQLGETSFAIRQPWAMAFAFGLLHGLGFASGLSTLGLPAAAIPLALLFFNVGVEIGQLIFVGCVAALSFSANQLRLSQPSLLARLPTYLVGSLGAYWTIDRVIMMGAGW